MKPFLYTDQRRASHMVRSQSAKSEELAKLREAHEFVQGQLGKR